MPRDSLIYFRTPSANKPGTEIMLLGMGRAEVQGRDEEIFQIWLEPAEGGLHPYSARLNVPDVIELAEKALAGDRAVLGDMIHRTTFQLAALAVFLFREKYAEQDAKDPDLRFAHVTCPDPGEKAGLSAAEQISRDAAANRARLDAMRQGGGALL